MTHTTSRVGSGKAVVGASRMASKARQSGKSTPKVGVTRSKKA